MEALVLDKSVKGSTVTLNWSHICPIGESCTYEIERGISKWSFSSYKTGIAALQESITESRGTYYYRVKASTSNSQSDYSNVVSARVR